MRPAWQVALLLFGSGLCALIYQTVWLREFRLIFGGSTAASAAVLAIFMGGLGLGGLLLGRRADEQARPLEFYGRLELAISLATALTPLLLWLVRRVYLGAGGSLALGEAGATCARLVLAALVLSVPTIAMGGTLPAAARAAVDAADTGRRRLALLYATNTLGAVTGALLATFVLLERFGNRGCLWLACGLNAAIALTAIALGRRSGQRAETRQATAFESEPDAEPAADPGPGRRGEAARTTFILWAAGLCGMAFFLMELVWYRMLSPLLGGSVFTFGLILAVALLGVGLGGAIYTIWNPRRCVSLSGLAWTFSLEALCVAVPFALGDRIALLALEWRRLVEAGFYANALGWAAIAAIVVFPAALIAGFQFPLLIALLGQGRDRVGDQVGRAYAWNTAGAIAGSLAGGFGLLPRLTAPGAWRLVVVVLALVALAALVLDGGGSRRGVAANHKGRAWRIGVAPLGISVVAVLLLMGTGPTSVWRHSGIGAGRADAFRNATHGTLRDQAQAWRRALIWEAEGIESNVALVGEKGLAFVINGKNDGSGRADAGTAIMSGLLGPLLRPEIRRSLVIGLGTGMTAGWLATVPAMERVDTLELEPAVVRVAAACEPVNAGALKNPKLKLLIGDARELLALLPGPYDLIASEPSNPFRAGVASLFTREFYLAAKEKLTRRGLFLQWMQAYEVDLATLQTACGTLATVFPVVETWATQVGDLMFVGANEPIDYDVASLRQRMNQEPFRSALAKTWRAHDLEGVFAHFLSSDVLAREVARLPGLELNTDDRTIMEFRFARTVAVRQPFDTRDWLTISRDRNADRPPVRGGPFDWERVEDRRISMFMLEGVDPPTLPPPGSSRFARARAKAHYAKGNLGDAWTAWSAQSQGPDDAAERLLAAECAAEFGAEQAVAYLEELRATQPIEAEVILARLRWRQGRLPEAVAALESAFVGYRTDPWPWLPLMYRSLDLAQALSNAARDPGLARRLHGALGEPFAVRIWDQARLACRFNVALDTLDAGRLRESIQAFEPHVPWRRAFLDKRSACYRLLGDPRADRAEKELAAFERANR